MSLFDPFPILDTPRLRLRPLGPDDAAVLYRWQQSPDFMRYLSRDPDASLSASLARVELISAAIREETGITWGLTLRTTGALVGTAGLWRWVKPHRYAEIGYQLAPEAWGQGLMTEALPPILQLGFERMQLHRIEANTDPNNHASTRVLGKLGFQLEARLRENWFHNGSFTDSTIYGLLRHEARFPPPPAAALDGR